MEMQESNKINGLGITSGLTNKSTNKDLQQKKWRREECEVYKEKEKGDGGIGRHNTQKRERRIVEKTKGGRELRESEKGEIDKNTQEKRGEGRDETQREGAKKSHKKKHRKVRKEKYRIRNKKGVGRVTECYFSAMKCRKGVREGISVG